MVGYNLRISELKRQPKWRCIGDALRLSYPDSFKRLIEGFQGKTVSYSDFVTPWLSVGDLIDDVAATGDGALLHGGGYPYLLTARGDAIISQIAEAEGSNHSELKELLKPRTLYFVEAWDLS